MRSSSPTRRRGPTARASAIARCSASPATSSSASRSISAGTCPSLPGSFPTVPFARPDALLDQLDQTLPERPFSLEMWDGSRLPATNGGGGPVFKVRSPAAIAHALRAPGQLGLGRAYVAGDLEVDDLDAVIAVLQEWKPPPLERGDKLRLA